MTDSMLAATIRALAAIDDALGLPQDGCNSTEQTIDEIKRLRAAADRGEALARSVMADQTGSDK